jgi:hypothetical protein
MTTIPRAGNGGRAAATLPKSQPLDATLCLYASLYRAGSVAVAEFVMVVWLASGGRIERPTDAAECARVLSLYQSSLALGQSLLMTTGSSSRVVLDVRCTRRSSAPVS